MFLIAAKNDTFIKLNKKNMNFNCEEQLAGVAEIDFYLLDEVSNWPVILTDQNSNQLIFAPGVNSVEATIKPDSIKMVINKKETPSGIVFQINIKMDFLTRSEALEQLLEQYENKPGVVHAKLNNEFQKILGSNLEPLQMIYETDDSTKIDGDASTSIVIKGETSKRPVYFTV